MHNLNVLILGPPSFINTLNELKAFLKFIPLSTGTENNHHIILFHKDALHDKTQKNLIEKDKSIKICATAKKEKVNSFDANLELPATLKEINSVIESIAAKKEFFKNSSIKVKDYLLDKNEKKLSKLEKFVILTEKEIQLIELLLDKKDPISKDNILSSVWNYSSNADTHTVETHIYRLRKKISDKFIDEKFILNSKDGYYF